MKRRKNGRKGAMWDTSIERKLAQDSPLCDEKKKDGNLSRQPWSSRKECRLLSTPAYTGDCSELGLSEKRPITNGLKPEYT